MSNYIVNLTNQAGAPLPGVILQSGQYNTTPCPFGSFGCTSGPGNPIEGTTDENGQCVFSIPYTCPGEWSGNWYADGFDLLPWDVKTGSITGDVKQTLVMVATIGSSGNTPKGNAQEGNLADQTAAGLQGTSPGGKAFMDWISTYWWVIVLAVILVILLILALHHKSGGARSLNIGQGGKVAVV